MNNLYEFYRDCCTRYSDNILFDNSITYGKAFDYALARAAFLQKEGFKNGDIIAILAANSAEWCITYMAITAMGAIALPLDTNLNKDSYRYMLDTAKAKAAFISPSFKGYIRGLPTYQVALKKAMHDAAKFKAPKARETDIASLLFTSGTTGIPKIVALSHLNMFSTGISTSQYLKLDGRDSLLCILPLFHAYAFDANFIGPFAAGSSLIFQPSLKGPDIMKSLAENKITIFPAAPLMWELFFDGIINKIKSQSMAKYRLFMFLLNYAPVLKMIGLSPLLRKVFKPVRDIFGDSMRFFISGGAPLKRKYFHYYNRMGLTIIEGYGLTETTGPISIAHYDDNVPGTVGPPMIGNEVKVKNVNKDGLGEIWLRGNSVMLGYYRDKKANSTVFDDEGFFNSGDIGRIDAKNRIFLTGRAKNTIVLDSGKNVYPEELESFYKQSTHISEISVFSRKIDGREILYAAVVPVKKSPESFAEIRSEIERLNKGLPGYKAVHRIAVSFDPLPKNSTRKILVDKVRQMLEAGLYQTDEGGSPVLQNMLTGTTLKEEQSVAALKQKLKSGTLYASQTLSDFNIDSLGLIDLIVFLEDELNISIDTDRFRMLQTLEELVLFLASCEPRKGAGLDDMILRGDITTRASSFFNPFNELFLLFVKTISKLCWKLTTTNRELLAPENAIVAANHQSNLDVLWILSEMPRRYRKNIYLIGKKELWFLKYIFLGAPIIFVNRGGNVIPALKAGADILRQGKSLIIFPEGTRTRNGALGDFKTGAAYLATQLGCKIIPVRLTGSFDILPTGKFMPKFFSGHRGALKIGAAFDPKDYASVEDLNRALYNCISDTLN